MNETINNPINVKLVYASLEKYDSEYVEEISRKGRYVSDAIGDDYQTFTSDIPIIINAPCGCGKTYFILKIISSYAQSKNKNVLFVSNRTAVSSQMKIATAKNTCQHKYLTQEGIENASTIVNIGFMTYQSLYAKICSEEKFKFDYVIFDECHYAYSDATFNRNTYALFRKMPRVFKDSTRIYMSATIDRVLPYIVDSEVNKEKLRLNKLNSIIETGYCSSNINLVKLYRIESNNENVNVHYFTDTDEMLNKIKKCEDKSLIFINNKEEGATLAEKLGEGAVFIDSKIKNSGNNETYKQIIETEKFDCKILVSTSVLDNGINIKDNDLKNIVLFCTDETEIVQMIGRKRMREGETVNVYLHSPSESKWKKKLSTVQQVLDALSMIKRNPKKFSYKYILEENEVSTLVRKILLGDNKKWFFNKIAFDSYIYQRDFITTVLDGIGEKPQESYIKFVLNRLNFEYNEENWVEKDIKEIDSEFIKFLEQYVDKDITDKFNEDFKEIYIKCYGKNNADRNDRKWGTVMINNRLAVRKLPFEILDNKLERKEKND